MEVNIVMAVTQRPSVRTSRNHSFDKLCTKVAKLEACGRTEKPHYKKETESPTNKEHSR